MGGTVSTSLSAIGSGVKKFMPVGSNSIKSKSKNADPRAVEFDLGKFSSHYLGGIYRWQGNSYAASKGSE